MIESIRKEVKVNEKFLMWGYYSSYLKWFLKGKWTWKNKPEMGRKTTRLKAKIILGNMCTCLVWRKKMEDKFILQKNQFKSIPKRKAAELK